MRFFNNIKVLKKESAIRKELDCIIGKLPSSDLMAKSILKELKNNKTKIVFDKEIKGNYYVYLNDTIYLSDKQNQKENYERLCVISHECIHSIQPKWLQNLNFIFSNLELITFLVFVILWIFKVSNIYFWFSYLVINLFSIIFRSILELWAMNKSLSLSKKYLEKEKINKKDIEKVESVYNSIIKLLIPLAFIQMFFFKVIRILIIFILNFYRL